LNVFFCQDDSFAGVALPFDKPNPVFFDLKACYPVRVAAAAAVKIAWDWPFF